MPLRRPKYILEDPDDLITAAIASMMTSSDSDPHPGNGHTPQLNRLNNRSRPAGPKKSLFRFLVQLCTRASLSDSSRPGNGPSRGPYLT